MNTTTNTRGVSEAMVERFKAAFAEHSTISPGYDGCIRAALEAALSGPEPAAQGEAQRSSHRVFRREDWLPCYCAAQADHPIGAEKAAQPAERVPEGFVVERVNMGRGDEMYIGTPDGCGTTVSDKGPFDSRILFRLADAMLTAAPAPSEGGKGVEALIDGLPPGEWGAMRLDDEDAAR